MSVHKEAKAKAYTKGNWNQKKQPILTIAEPYAG